MNLDYTLVNGLSPRSGGARYTSVMNARMARGWKGRRSRASGAAALVSLAAIALGAAGCSKPLFPDNTYRTQYDHYDRLRGDFVEARQTDPYGRPVPALRQRLRQR